MNARTTKMTIGSPEWKKTIVDGAALLKVAISPKVVDALAVYADELLRWNRKMNLTAITDEREIAIKHFLDSCYLVHVLEGRTSLLDIGSGAGFPGIPLKLLEPSMNVTLIDASQKKVNFMKHVIRRLGLTHIEAIHVRAEDLKEREKFQRAFDMVTSRALTSVDHFITLALPFLADEGVIVALKSNVYEKEKSVMDQMNEGIEKDGRFLRMDVKDYELPFIHAFRTLVVLRQKKGVV